MIVFDQLKRNDPHLRVLTLAVLAGLWWVQIISYRHYSENQKAQSFRTVRIPAIRGKILDRNATALAENQPSYNVTIYLDELRDGFKKEWARVRPPRGTKVTLAQRRALEAAARYRVFSNSVAEVARVLQLPIQKGYSDFMTHYTNQLALPMRLLENLSEQQVARFLESSANPPGVDLEVHPTRYYPGGSLCSHVLGFLVPDNRSMEGEVADFNFRLSDYRGRVGIEGDFDAELRGRAGVKSVLVNSLGYRQSENIWVQAEPGKNVILTIDARIQAAAEAALESSMPNARGAVVVMDPNTGDVLAIASAPAGNPNAWIPKINPDEWRRLNDETQRPQVNRAMQENYAPGSIFKMVTGLACLERGLDPAAKIVSNGEIRVPGRNRPIDDLAKPGTYDFKEAFVKSSNTYFISNGLRAGIESILRIGQRLHLGERTGLLSSQETAGHFPTMADVRHGWIPPDTAYICIGQGRMDVTPLQMAVMVSAIANGGKVLWPRLVQRIEPADPASDTPPIEFPPKPPRDNLDVSARSLEITRSAMLSDVEEGGTGKMAMVPGLRIGGKTGTAQVTDSQGKVVGHTTWFASCAPFESPRWVVVVMVEEGSSGGGTCAPAAGKIYRAIQKLADEPRPRVVANN
ncbi:MAG TPA: penicillin-binding transpeptidase domain-containing protein [Verrucomicrobiae bacterium]|nr:penicillin-binding transpeptidase domain-containing protein [Verrucomicrobiae bacterium]